MIETIYYNAQYSFNLLWYVLAFLLFGVATGLQILRRKQEKKENGWTLKISNYVLFTACAINAYLIVAKWIELGHFPFIKFGLFLFGFAFFTALSYFILARNIPVAGMIASLSASIAMFFRTVMFDGYETPYVQAILDHFWTIPHIFTYFIGYGALALSCGIGFVGILIFLYEQKYYKKKEVDFSLSQKYDELNHKIIIFGYVFISLGLFIGGAWAHKAWADYWGWDIKEVFSLISWFVYTAYLHLRYIANWKGLKCQIFAFLAFISVGATYSMMNVFPQIGSVLHSYG